MYSIYLHLKSQFSRVSTVQRRSFATNIETASNHPPDSPDETSFLIFGFRFVPKVISPIADLKITLF